MKPAVRESVPLLVGLFGPSGGGKSFSALRLATGIQRVCGGQIAVIDTEARRMLHYADKFKFNHVDFKAPFGPLDYLAAINYCAKQGAKIIIVDSLSNEHEGEGGVLDQHDIGMNGQESKSMLAWKKPKMERRRLINSILQMPINFIFCFRAKEKIKLSRDGNGKMVPSPQGFMPIAGEEFLFEQTLNCLLLPKANGIPEWNPHESGERLMTKLPSQFFDLFKNPRSLDEGIGVHLAEWAKGGIPRAVEQSNGNAASIPENQNGRIQDAPNEVAAPEFAEGFADDLDYAASQANSDDVQESRNPTRDNPVGEKESNPAGPSSIEGAIENIYPPKSEKAPWNIKIQGIRMAVWKKSHPKEIAWFAGLDIKKPLPKTRFRVDYTTEVSGQYTNHTLVAIESIK